ncbi:MAG: hypothetical protein ACK542_00420, partial [Burkholderiales bacterium]
TISKDNEVSYIYRFFFDSNPHDELPGLVANFPSQQPLNSSAIAQRQEEVRNAEKLQDLTQARKLLEAAGFSNITHLPKTQKIEQPTPKISREEKTNPSTVIEIKGPSFTIFVSQDGKKIWVAEGLSLPPGKNPTTQDRIDFFNTAREVTNPEEFKKYAQIIQKVYRQLPELPQPLGFPLPQKLRPPYNNNGRDDTELPDQPKITM